MKHLSDLQIAMEHPCTVNKTDNAGAKKARTDNSELSKQNDWTPPQTECPYFL